MFLEVNILVWILWVGWVGNLLNDCPSEWVSVSLEPVDVVVVIIIIIKQRRGNGF